jgi:protein involved in polysaccharide export with SLBB domain
VFILLLAAASPVDARAQQGVTPGRPSRPTEAELLARLRESGTTRQEARDRLSQFGYDPSLVDPYFDRIEGRTNQSLDVQDAFVQALLATGLLSGAQGRAFPTDSILFGLDSIAKHTVVDRPTPDTFQVFGRSVFSSPSTQFQPVTMGPVDAGYRVGPGDELLLVLTGGVELAHTMNVTREGFVVIPDVGQLFVNGLTLDGLRNQLYERLGRVYSGVRRGAGATTFFDISLGRLRTNQVFVIGDAVRPGAYQVSAAATTFNALQRAGGPSNLGSFRRVQVRRGGAIAADVDLYDYLIAGDASRDVRLDQGDIVFIPPAGPQVTVEGRVRRPAIYELAEGEGLRELLAFAGGLQADAALQRVQIDRVLPQSERIPGVERVLLDVQIAQLFDANAASVPLRDGDQIYIFATLVERRNRVFLTGSVFHPGLYEYRPGMTVWELIRQADGLAEGAFRPLAHVIRPIQETGGRRLLQISLETDATGRPVSDLPLADRDSVVVYAADSLATREFVHVEGLVKDPGPLPFAEGATVRDVILAAGGFTEGAAAHEAEVVRLRRSLDRNDTIAFRHRVALARDLPSSWAPAVNGESSDLASGSSFRLEPADRIFVRRMPGYVLPRTVQVIGEVLNAGPYAAQFRDERLSSMISRAGGVTSEAYVRGTRLTRDSVLVGIDLEAALRRPGGREDIILEDGDVIEVPRFDPTVLVEGAVTFATRVLYREGRSVMDYVREAGGTMQDADEDRISVTYPSGRRATVNKTLFFRDSPAVEPGSVIFVPRKTDVPGDWSRIVSMSVSIVSAAATLIIAVNTIR